MAHRPINPAAEIRPKLHQLEKELDDRIGGYYYHSYERGMPDLHREGNDHYLEADLSPTVARGSRRFSMSAFSRLHSVSLISSEGLSTADTDYFRIARDLGPMPSAQVRLADYAKSGGYSGLLTPWWVSC